MDNINSDKIIDTEVKGIKNEEESKIKSPRYYFKIIDMSPGLFPRITVEVKGILKALGAQYNSTFQCWVLSLDSIDGEDILHLRWIVGKILTSNLQSKLDVELFVIDKDGKSEKLRSLADEIQHNSYPDGRLIQVMDDVLGEITKSGKFVIEDDILRFKKATT